MNEPTLRLSSVTRLQHFLGRASLMGRTRMLLQTVSITITHNCKDYLDLGKKREGISDSYTSLLNFLNFCMLSPFNLHYILSNWWLEYQHHLLYVNCTEDEVRGLGLHFSTLPLKCQNRHKHKVLPTPASQIIKPNRHCFDKTKVIPKIEFKMFTVEVN